MEMVDGARVSDGFFRTLGVAPVLGRDFFAGEDLARSTWHYDSQLCFLAKAFWWQTRNHRPANNPK
jgi:hypothetical protein